MNIDREDGLYSMKFILSAFLLILLGQNIFAQQYHFNKRYDLNQSSAEGGSTVISTDSGSLVMFATTNSTGTGGLLQRGLLFLNDTAFIQIYHLDSIPNIYIFISLGTNLIKLSNNELITGSSIQDTLGNVDATLTRFDSSQHVKWMTAYGDTGFQSGWMARHTRDNGFILAGQAGVNNFGYNDDAMLIKTDSNGVIEWQKYYGGYKNEVASAMDTCFDGGYILAGDTKTFGVGTPSQRCGNCYAIKTDSVGNLQWYKTFGGVYGDAFNSCLQSKDGNYVFAGNYVISDPYFPNCNIGSIKSKPYIVKLDTAGNTIWAKTYGATAYDMTIFSIKELANGDLIGAGTYDTAGSPPGVRGLIVRTNNNGDSLWYLTYSGFIDNISDSYLYDIALSNDGGFVATGWVVPHMSADTGNQDIWVLKIDSNGCEVANCIIPSTGDIINNYPNDFGFYPNPSDGIFNIHNEMNAILVEAEVYNCFGAKVFTQKGSLQRIDLSKEPDGIYFYSIRIKNGRVFKGKIVKE
jgi:hypothetical protein